MVCATQIYDPQSHMVLSQAQLCFQRQCDVRQETLAYTCCAEFSKCNANTGKPVFRMGEPCYTATYILLSPKGKAVCQACNLSPPYLFAKAWLPGLRANFWDSCMALNQRAVRKEKQDSTLLSLGAAFKLTPSPLISAQVMFAAVPEPDWFDFQAWTWTCLIYVDVSCALDSQMALVAVTALGTAWRSILWLIATRDLQFPWTGRQSARLAPGDLEDHPNSGIPQAGSGHLICPDKQWTAWVAAVSGGMPWAWFGIKGCVDIGKVIYKAKWRESWVYSSIRYHNSSWLAWYDSTAVTI